MLLFLTSLKGFVGKINKNYDEKFDKILFGLIEKNAFPAILEVRNFKISLRASLDPPMPNILRGSS